RLFTILSFCFYCYGYYRDLPSFPTRRSSDLPHVGAGRAIGAVGIGEEDQRHRRGYDLVRTELPHVELICQERGRCPCRPRMYGVKDGPTHEFERRAASPAKSRFAGICA